MEHDKQVKMKSIVRIAILAALSVSLTSCSTFGSLMNSFPVRMMDEAASGLVGFFAENDLPANGKPASIEERASKVENRGIYAGRTSAAGSPQQSMAAR